MTEPSLDQNALGLLDAYLARLQAGERPDREALLKERPDLASAINCLEALEMLAPPVGQADVRPWRRRCRPPPGCRAISAPTN